MAVENDRFVLTKSGYDHLKRQLELLEQTEIEQREQVNDSVSDSLSNEGSADAGAEFEWRTRKNWTDEHIAHLRFILERAEIYEDPDPSRVNTGERVTLWDFAEKAEVQFDVLSSPEVTSEADVGPGVRDVSDVSPIGQALLGKAIGDVIEVEVPDGKVRYAIRKIERIPE
jgi:transcription elongation factor GreA